jgi:hypothetical protein
MFRPLVGQRVLDKTNGRSELAFTEANQSMSVPESRSLRGTPCVQRWLVRLCMPTAVGRLTPPEVMALTSELGYLRAAINTEAVPPYLEVSVLADSTMSAARYARNRVEAVLAWHLGRRARCEPVDVLVDVRGE